MNCPNCNAPLENNARFCPKCGQPTSVAAPNNATNTPINADPRYQPTRMNESEPPTIPPGYFQVPSRQQQQPWSQPPSTPPQQQPAWSQPQPQSAPSAPSTQSPPSSYKSSNRPDVGGNMFTSTQEEARPRRRGRGCLVRSIITLVVLLLLIGGGFFFGVRPFVLSQLDTVLTTAVNNIPPPVSQAPAGPVQISEQLLNNLLVLQSSPDDIVKNPHISITSNAMRMEFQVFGFDCAVSGAPQLQHGQLVMTNANVEGIVALILTPDDITTLVNKHLVDAQKKINHSIESVQLKDQELDMVLGPANGGGLPPLP